jgi:Fe/S biogenesis protein NfuA
MDQVIRVTAAALEVVGEALAREQEPELLALWLEVNGIADGAYTYDLWFGPASGIAPGDEDQLEGGVRVAVPAQSVERVRGSVLDAGGRSGGAGLVILNPNTPAPAARSAPPRGDLVGPAAAGVLEVLAKDVNPFLAGHGGHVDLVGVEGSTAYVELSGGCHGCGMALSTLSQGIAVAITDAVAEIREVVDVTDHRAGRNPYFQPEQSGSVAG